MEVDRYSKETTHVVREAHATRAVMLRDGYETIALRLQSENSTCGLKSLGNPKAIYAVRKVC